MTLEIDGDAVKSPLAVTAELSRAFVERAMALFEEDEEAYEHIQAEIGHILMNDYMRCASRMHSIDGALAAGEAFAAMVADVPDMHAAFAALIPGDLRTQACCAVLQARGMTRFAALCA